MASESSSSSQASGASHDTESFLRRLSRTTICGVLFGLPFCAAAPTSPLLRLFISPENKKTVLPRLMRDFFWVNFAASAISYNVFVEPRIDNSFGKSGWMPYLGPMSAQAPAWGCLVFSHLYYPGLWALMNEVTWRERVMECGRLCTKTFFAYSTVHIPFTVLAGAVIGITLYPLKLRKLHLAEREA